METVELKNIITKKPPKTSEPNEKSSRDGLNSRIDGPEERIHELKDTQ